MNFPFYRHHRILIYRTIFCVVAVLSGLMILDKFLPVKHIQEKAVFKSAYKHVHSGRYTTWISYNYVIKTRSFMFEANEGFFNGVTDSIPINIYYSPIFNFVIREDSHAADSQDNKIYSEAKNSIYNTAWYFPAIIFILSFIGIFLRSEEREITFLTNIIIITVMLLIGITPYI